MSQEETDYAWLDKVVAELPMVHQFGCGALEYSDGGLMDYTCHCGNSRKAKTTIQAHLTVQTKQHQVELLRARIGTLNSLLPEFDMIPMISGWQPFPWATMRPEDQKEAKEWQAIHSHAAMYYHQFVKDQIEQLQAELDKLEGKNE